MNNLIVERDEEIAKSLHGGNKTNIKADTED